MKKIINLLTYQMLIITFGILLGNGIIALIGKASGTEYTFSASFPITVILTGILTSLPTLIFYIKKIPYIAKIIIHFIVLIGIITLVSYMLEWSRTLFDFIAVLSITIPIYIAVWVFTYIKYKRDEKQINKALINNSDED